MKRNIFKAVLVILAFTFQFTNVFGQTPQKISYQSVIRNADDALITNHGIGMQVSILQGAEDGTLVYSETHSPGSNANGLVTIEIGAGDSNDDFSAIDWSKGPYFIKTETDPTEPGGTNYSISGISRLLSVPYALHAKTAENTFSGNYNSLTNIPDMSNYDTDVTDDFSGDYNDLNNKPSLFDGDYTSLTNIPDMSNYDTDVSDDFSGDYDDLNNKPSLFDGDYSSLANIPDMSNYDTDVSDDFSGDYDDLSNKPSLFDGDYTSLTNIPDMSNYDTDVSDDFSGDYNDLTNKPDIPENLDGSETIVTGGAGISVMGTGTSSDPYVVAETSKHYVGEIFDGGIVFYVSPDGQSGLMASLDDLDNGSGAEWGLYNTNVNNCESMTNGADNTAAILAMNPAAGTAAVLCHNHNGGGNTDWYLPSLRELVLLFAQDVIIDKILDNDGDPNTNGFTQEYDNPTNGTYWSSSESSYKSGCYFQFFYNASNSYYKYTKYKVRAIRAY